MYHLALLRTVPMAGRDAWGPRGPLLATEREEHHTAGVPPRMVEVAWVLKINTGAGYQLLNRGNLLRSSGRDLGPGGPRCPAHAPAATAAPYAGDVGTSEMGTCAICYQPMIMHPDQVAHPSCEAVT
jgi:hypothetical protein